MAFPSIKSVLDVGAQQYQQNRKSWQSIVSQYSAALEETCSEGKTRALERHISRDQLLGISTWTYERCCNP